MNRPPRIALLACRVFEAEITIHGGNAPHIVLTKYLEIALHDRSDHLRASLQREIDALDARDDIDAIVLAYALCGLGTTGIRAGKHPLIIARGHDCMTMFIGSKEAFASQQAASPDSFYYTPGWMQANRTPGPARLEAMRAELSQRFDDPEDVEFLLESEKAHWAQHGKAVFLDLGTSGADDHARRAATDAAALGWKFERIPGNPSLLRDLLTGPWDNERFQMIEPGCILQHSPDSHIFRKA